MAIPNLIQITDEHGAQLPDAGYSEAPCSGYRVRLIGKGVQFLFAKDLATATKFLEKLESGEPQEVIAGIWFVPLSSGDESDPRQHNEATIRFGVIELVKEGEQLICFR